MNVKFVAAAFVGLVAVVPVSGTPSTGQEGHSHAIDEIVVTAAFKKSAAETALPITVLSGEKLQEQVANTLGETLQNEIGLANASFGTGVGQPIIRGQTGNRVKVLENGAGVTDASSLSPDHANGVATVLADRLEIIRGPATLLYGSGAIGGVVNIIDGRIPDRLFDKPGFDIQQSYDSVNGENRTIGRLDFSAGNFAIHVEGFKRDGDDVDIDGFAVDTASLEILEEMNHAEEEHEDDDHGEEAEITNTHGFIGNSDSESDGYSFGLSWIGDKGFVGFSYSELDNEYGLPPGVHSHHHEEEEGEEHHAEDEDEDHEGEEEVEFVRIGMEKQRLDLRGEYNFDSSLLNTLRFSFGSTEYNHAEIEIFEDGISEVGTLFENEGIEGRATIDLSLPGAWSAVLGTQFSATEFSAIGEEAFIPETDINANGVFVVTQYEADRYTVELGARYEKNEVDPSGSGCDFDESSVSASGSFLYELDDQNNLLFGVSHSERAPSVEELFSNISTSSCTPLVDEDLVFHAATNLLEIGNPNLDTEVSNNIELGWRKHAGRIRTEVNFYYNEISDYVFLDVTGDEIDEQSLAHYRSNDAAFTGIEARATFDLVDGTDTDLELSFFGDAVSAKFDSGGYIPRIAPGKVGTSVALLGDEWSAHMSVIRFLEQNDPAIGELATDGYTQVTFYGDYHWPVGAGGQFKIFLQGSNLLDEDIRNHASLLKHYAPEPGLNLRIGLRLSY